MSVEVARDLRVARRNLRPERIGREVRDGQLHFIVAAAVLLFEVPVGNRHPLGERRPQLLDDQLTVHAVLELVGRHRRPLHPQQLLVALLADEGAVLLKRRNRQNPLAHFLVVGVDAQTIGFGERRALVDHLREDLAIDPELLD